MLLLRLIRSVAEDLAATINDTLTFWQQLGVFGCELEVFGHDTIFSCHNHSESPVKKKQ
jgi:hypothetical protein